MKVLSPETQCPSHGLRTTERVRRSELPKRRMTGHVYRLQIKRVYEPAAVEDGHRVLVDHIWPRGLSKKSLRIETWMKSIAPSTALRKWFGHEPRKWDAFRGKYHAELQRKPDDIASLLTLAREGVVTLVYAARDEAHNNALALAEYLRGL